LLIINVDETHVLWGLEIQIKTVKNRDIFQSKILKVTDHISSYINNFTMYLFAILKYLSCKKSLTKWNNLIFIHLEVEKIHLSALCFFSLSKRAFCMFVSEFRPKMCSKFYFMSQYLINYKMFRSFIERNPFISDNLYGLSLEYFIINKTAIT
jgi:hypothetical protein